MALNRIYTQASGDMSNATGCLVLKSTKLVNILYGCTADKVEEFHIKKFREKALSWQTNVNATTGTISLIVIEEISSITKRRVRSL